MITLNVVTTKTSFGMPCILLSVIKLQEMTRLIFRLFSYSEKNQHGNNIHGKRTPNGKRSPSWDSGELPKKRVRRDSQREKSEPKKQKTVAELNAECEADIR